MNNLLSYCGLVDAKIRASDKDLPVKDSILDFAGNVSYVSTSGQLSETMFSGQNHQITGYLFSDHNFAFEANFYWAEMISRKKSFI